MKKEKDKQPMCGDGHCHGCGKVVDERICICTTCTGRGITHESLGLGEQFEALKEKIFQEEEEERRREDEEKLSTGDILDK
jgi:hypothetical protein